MEGFFIMADQGCWNCKYLKPLVSWWCGNDEAIKHWNSALPRRKNCPFWEAEVVKENKGWFKTILGCITKKK
jgi:hypothetical protein